MAATFSAVLIDTEYLTDLTPMGANIDPLQIAPFIEEAQDVYIQDILGTAFYNDICYKIYSGYTQSSWTTDEYVVVELSSKILAYYTVYMALPHLAIKIRNVGVARTQGDNIIQSTMEEMRYLREEVKNLAEFYAQRLINHLCTYASKYPLYVNPGKDVPPTSGQYDSDIYLDNGVYGLTDAERKFLQQYYWNR